ncbi:sialidase family protein, partial [Bradyrhizobium sp. NBAIM08]|uniref:sialidase family protein n=1 Tax=Bradyrhizobium sp. NBAIM08 TaxID=2793815 RepID=UPI001CD5CCFB
LASYNPRPAKGNASGHYGIRTKKSYDGGLSWTDERLLYEAGSKFEDGCWEPSQIQLPSGEIRLFFSDEGPYTNSNEQNISLFRSLDNGLAWTAQPQMVSFRAGKRDGMPVPVLLKDKNEILFSIED